MTVNLSHTVTREGQVVLRATHELDLVGAPHLAEAIDVLVRAGARRLVLDLTELEFIDSTAVSVLVPRVRALRAHGGDLVVAAHDPRVVRPFTASRTDEVLAVVPTVADAEGVIELRAARTRRRPESRARAHARTQPRTRARQRRQAC